MHNHAAPQIHQFLYLLELHPFTKAPSCPAFPPGHRRSILPSILSQTKTCMPLKDAKSHDITNPQSVKAPDLRLR